MTEPILSPAEEADAENLLAGLAEPAGQYAGLTPVERAVAESDEHMSTCDEPDINECGDCQRKLARFRRVIERVRPVIEQEARHDERLRADDEITTEIAKQILDLLEPGALTEWLRLHSLAVDAGPGATLAAYLGDLAGTCPVCFADQNSPSRHAVPDDGSYPDGTPVAADLGQERSEEQQHG